MCKVRRVVGNGLADRKETDNRASEETEGPFEADQQAPLARTDSGQGCQSNFAETQAPGTELNGILTAWWGAAYVSALEMELSLPGCRGI